MPKSLERSEPCEEKYRWWRGVMCDCSGAVRQKNCVSTLVFSRSFTSLHQDTSLTRDHHQSILIPHGSVMQHLQHRHSHQAQAARLRSWREYWRVCESSLHLSECVCVSTLFFSRSLVFLFASRHQSHHHQLILLPHGSVTQHLQHRHSHQA